MAAQRFNGREREAATEQLSVNSDPLSLVECSVFRFRPTAFQTLCFFMTHDEHKT